MRLSSLLNASLRDMPLMEPLVKGPVLTHYGRVQGRAPGQKLS